MVKRTRQNLPKKTLKQPLTIPRKSL